MGARQECGQRRDHTLSFGKLRTSVGAGFEVKNPGTGQEITKYYFAGASRVAMRKYVMPQSPTVNYMLYDHLGSTNITTDTNGAVVTGLRYRAWGEVRYPTNGANPGPSKYTYTGQYSNVDDFGLMFYNARWYDSYLNHFTQPDSIVPDLSNTQAWDRYVYSLNNPIRYTDPSGHWIESAVDIAFIAYDLYDISSNGLNWENGLSLAADVAGLALPLVTGGGLVVRGIAHADELAKAANTLENAVDAANAIDNALDTANAIDNGIDTANAADNLPLEKHHFATNKNKTFTPQLEEIAKKYGLDLDDGWNIQRMPHRGRHPNAYHQWVLRQMEQIENVLGDCGTNCADLFKDMFKETVIDPVMKNPEMLRKKFWIE